MAERAPLPVEAVDHLEYWVGNAKQSAYYYMHGFGFAPLAYAGPETGVRDRVSYVLGQGDIRIVLTTALAPEGPIADHVRRHGDGVRDIALRVPDAAAAYDEAVRRGARGLQEPVERRDEGGVYRCATIATYGDTVHTFVERREYRGVFAPGFGRWAPGPVEPVGLRAIDHIVGNVELGKMDEWVRFYEEVFGFGVLVTFDDKDISTEYSALRSKVVTNASGTVKLPINEPAPGRKKSQIEEYLDFYGGPGVQHLALRTDDILATVGALRERGIAFLSTPERYYDDLGRRVPDLAEPVDALRRLNILVDRDDQGYLLQIFTQPVEDRPTLFYEIIERKGSQSFGKGNFKALFEAIEREQERRGNL